MTRGAKKRTWVKLDCHGVLHGSINWLFNLEEQAVFLKLIPMAAIYCKTPGIISDNEGGPLPREFIAHELHCPLDILERVIEKGQQDNCLRDTEQGLELINFKYYQFTEYDRQRPYREKKKGEEQKIKKPVIQVPEWIDKETWDDYIEMRQRMRKPPSNGAIKLIIAKLERLKGASNDPNEVLKQSIMAGWTGVFPLKEGKSAKTRNSRNLPKTYTKPPDDD